MKNVLNTNRWRIAAWGSAALVLMYPLIAMQLTDEVKWGASDFALMTLLLLCTGLAFELVISRTRNTAYRAAAGVALLAAFVLIFGNGALGIIGPENNKVNFLYNGVVILGVLSALVARFRASGMALAMFVTAFSLVMVTVLACLSGSGSTASAWSLDTLGLTAFFALLFIGSGMLFRRAGQSRQA